MHRQDRRDNENAHRAALRTAEFVRDENTRRFRKQIRDTADPKEIERLNSLIETEMEIYSAALAARSEILRPKSNEDHSSTLRTAASPELDRDASCMGSQPQKS